MRPRLSLVALATMLAGCRAAGSEAPAPPLLVVRDAARPGGGSAASIDDSRALALALFAVHPGALRRLRRAIADFDLQLRRRAHPLTLALEPEAEPRIEDELQALERALLPSFTAARALLSARWTGEEISVSVEPICPEDAVACFPMWSDGPPERALERRARFYAWSYTHSAVLRAGADGADVAARLRELAGREASTIALVLPSDASRTATVAEVRAAALRIRRTLARIAAAQGRNAQYESDWLGVLSRVEDRPPALPVAFDAAVVLAVPKLQSLARTRDFAREIESAPALRPPSAPVRWIHHPAAEHE